MTNSKDLTNLAIALMKLPSTSDQPDLLSKVLGLATDELKEFPMKEFVSNGKRSILVSNIKPVPKYFKLLLNGHLDVIPAQAELFNPKIINEKLYGRGSQDMKGPAVCLISAFKTCAKKVDYPLALQLVTDEEIGGFDGTKYQINQGITADYVLVGESTNFDIKYETKGIVWIKITISGKTAHSAYLWNGQNAINEMAKVIIKLNKILPFPTKEAWRTTMNPSIIETTNTTKNKVPDNCSLVLDIRYPYGQKAFYLKKIKNALPENAKVEILLDEPAFQTEKNHKFIKQVQKVTKEVTGRKPKLIKGHGSSDLRFFQGKCNSGIEFGPIEAGLHSDDEWVDIQSLVEFCEIIKKVILL